MWKRRRPDRKQRGPVADKLLYHPGRRTDPYVWAAGRHDKIEKRKVTLGEYDEKLDQYQITDGLTEDDYIAYPEDSITEGEKVTKISKIYMETAMMALMEVWMVVWIRMS